VTLQNQFAIVVTEFEICMLSFSIVIIYGSIYGLYIRPE